MKKIETVISQLAFQSVRDLLMAEGRNIVVSEVRAEHERECTLDYRGMAHPDYAPLLKIETVVSDPEAMSVVHAILSVSRSSDSADHRPALSHLENVRSIGVTKLDH
jgi:nitrogen regulatory protein PII